MPSPHERPPPIISTCRQGQSESTGNRQSASTCLDPTSRERLRGIICFSLSPSMHHHPFNPCAFAAYGQSDKVANPPLHFFLLPLCIRVVEYLSHAPFSRGLLNLQCLYASSVYAPCSCVSIPSSAPTRWRHRLRQARSDSTMTSTATYPAPSTPPSACSCPPASSPPTARVWSSPSFPRAPRVIPRL